MKKNEKGGTLLSVCTGRPDERRGEHVKGQEIGFEWFRKSREHWDSAAPGKLMEVKISLMRGNGIQL